MENVYSMCVYIQAPLLTFLCSSSSLKVQVEEYKQLKESMNKGQDQPLLSDIAIKSKQAAAQDSVATRQEKNQETDSMVVLQ